MRTTRSLQALPDPLRPVDERILEMGALASSMLQDGFVALQMGSTYMAAGVREQTGALANLDEAIESLILDDLARGVSPETARQLLLRSKLITYLNRVGRYGFDLARAIGESQRLPAHGFDDLAPVVGDVVAMLEEILHSLQRRTAPDLDRLLQCEDRVDAAHERVRRAWTATAGELGLQRILVVRSLERAADNLCKAGEKLHYAATGQRVVLR